MGEGRAFEPSDPELGSAAASIREEWRADEEEWSRAAAQQWAHGRSLLDVARELMHRGDTVAVVVGETSFTGEVVDVGDDCLRLRAGDDTVDVRLTVPVPGMGDRDVGAGPAPVVLRVLRRARAGGRSGSDGASTLRARLLEYEADGAEIELGSALFHADLVGRLTVGRDHVHVRDRDGGETYVPLPWISWVTRRRGLAG
jgi:hypothetical protein